MKITTTALASLALAAAVQCAQAQSLQQDRQSRSESSQPAANIQSRSQPAMSIPFSSAYAMRALPASSGSAYRTGMLLPSTIVYPQTQSQTSAYSTSGLQPYQSPAPYIPLGIPAYIPLAGSSVLAGYPYGPAPLPGQQPYSGSGLYNGFHRHFRDYGEATSDYYGTGYFYPYYCPAGYDDFAVYPSVYSLYDGFPSYFYAPDSSLTIVSGVSTIFDPSTGEFYVFNSDPFDSFDDVSGVGFLPSAWSAPFAQIGQAWASGNSGLIDQYLPTGNADVAVGLNGAYAYSVGANDYRMMTRDVMSRLKTTDFRFTDARVRRNTGEATAYAVQKYRAASGASELVYLSYTLRRDTSLAGGYRLVGVNTSLQPQTNRQVSVGAHLGRN